MHLNFALHLVMHWFIEALYPHRAYNHVVLCILIILPFYVDLNQQEHTSIHIYICVLIRRAHGVQEVFHDVLLTSLIFELPSFL